MMRSGFGAVAARGRLRPRRFSWLLLAAVGLALGFGASAHAQVDPGSVVQTIDSSLWTPPSPDPSGISYRPDTGQLLTCDSEVEESVGGITLYQGVNVWTHTNTGDVVATATTVPWSNEPTGISFDPAGGRLFIADDVKGSIFEVSLGADGSFGTADDSRVRYKGYAAAGCDDLEDVTYDNFDGHLYIASGGSQEICRIGVGANGHFDGAPPYGDDTVVTMSVAAFGITDPEGIVYDPFWNTLVLADRGTRDLYELTPDGNFLRKIDVDFPSGMKPSGVTIAPGSANPALRSYFVTDRHVDNNDDPTENDGRIFEVVAIPLGGNGAPIVDAGPPQTVQWPTNNVDLDGFVSDDGHPYPPSSVALLWSKQSGPGSVTFGDPNSATTTASFSAPGSYVLQLVGNDSALASLDTVAITLSQDVTLSVSSAGPGAVMLDPPGGTYSFGQSVNLTALPDPGAAFDGWSGDLSAATNPETLVMSEDKSVMASFATLYDVTVASTGAGSVTLSPPGGAYPSGTLVTLTAAPGANAVFDGWGGALSGTTNPETILIDGDKSVSASFTQLFSVSAASVGSGSVSLSPATGPYPAGSTVTAAAIAGPDAAFVGWSGDLSGTTSPDSLFVDGDKSVTASFATLYDVSTSLTGPGSLSLDPPGGSYPAGTVVSVSATPHEGAVFDGFGGDLSGSVTPQLLTVDGDKSVSASFSPESYTLEVTSVGSGTVTIDPPGGSYEAGSTVTLTAVPATGFFFGGWSGDASGTANPLTVLMEADAAIHAQFNAAASSGACGIGPELVALLPPLGWLLHRRRKLRTREPVEV